MRGVFKIKGGLVLLLAILLITNVSAGIYFSQLQPSYNLGDVIDLNVTVSSSQEGPLKIKLFCNGNYKDIFNGPPITNIRIPLNYLWIGDLKGDCYFSGEYIGESKSSSQFKISNELIIGLSVDSFFAKPGETIIISGTVKRINNEGSNGDVEITMPFSGSSTQSTASNDTNETTQTNNNIIYAKIENGEFSTSITIPKNIPAGDYKININAYEQDSSGEKTNEGLASASLKVSQIPTNIDFALNNQNFNPGDSLTLKPTLLDQTGSPIKDQVSIIITDEKLKRVFEKIAQSEDTVDFKIPTNLTSGYYSIRASSSDLNLTKSFYLNEKAIASFELRNSTLVIKNIGNMEYKKDIQIELNGKPFVKKIVLGLGETKEFKLTGTEGSYDVRISDGTTEFKQGGVLLTGRAIGVSDAKGNSVIEKINPFVWSFLIIVLLGGFLVFFITVYKKRSVAYPTDFDKKKKTLKLSTVMNDKKEMQNQPLTPVKHASLIVPKKLVPPVEAEPGMVISGQRSKVAILALKIKNRITRDSKINIENALDPVYEARGCIYEQGEFIMIIFTPLITHSLKNEVEASKIAEKITYHLKDCNKRFKEKIEFGIGINSAEILNEIRDGKLMFTALGNSAILARKLAESSNEQALLSKEAFERGITEIKADKKTIGSIEAYELRKVADYDKNRKFINDFIKRNEKEKPKGFGSAQPMQFKPLPKIEPKPAQTQSSGFANNPASNNISNKNLQ